MQTNPIFPLILIVAVALAGCSTVGSRIANRQAEFSTWPPAVQEMVAAGKIDLGFTREQVQVALGEPDRTFTRTSADGTSEVWGYRDRGPRFSFGVGFGGFGGSTAYGSSVMLGTGYQDEEKLGIVFDRMGKVSSIETRKK